MRITSFIHGGAWRDPRDGFDEIIPTIDKILGPDSQLYNAKFRLAGFASLNYRLSVHPAFVQDAESTPNFALRTAKHPDHLRDIWAGLSFLQDKFAFGSDYVFFGHSAGAFLNYQALLGESMLKVGGEDVAGGITSPPANVSLPVAVVGFEGIYDLCGLNDRTKGAYAEFFEPPFGTDRDWWTEASPATAKGNYKTSWGTAGKLAVLAHAPQDELVDMAELDIMEKRLKEDGVQNVLVFRDLVGGHMGVLRDGQFARVLALTIQELDKLDEKSL